MISQKLLAIGAAFAVVLTACGGSAAAAKPSAAPSSAPSVAAPTSAPASTSAGPEESDAAQASDAPAGSARQVTLEISAGKITPATVTVKKGETITFVAKNAGTAGQVELIVGLATDVAADSGDSLKEAEEIDPGTSKTVTYTFSADGPYAFGDQVEDHYAKGAKGDIVLQP